MIIDGRGLIRGAHIVGVGAAEVIQALLIAIYLKVPLAKLSEKMFVYPILIAPNKRNLWESSRVPA